MARRIAVCAAVAAALAAAAPEVTEAQSAQSVLQAAAQAMGTNTVRCVTYTGTGYVGIVGQNHDIRTDWARVELASYTRTIHYEQRAAREERVIRQGNNPPRGGGGIPIQGEQRQVQFVADKFAWNLQGTTVVPQPAAAEVRQLDLWLNPHGFIKAAMAPGANPVLITRYEGGALGGLNATRLRRLNIVSIVVLGKYRVNATINDQNLVERVQTWIPNPVRGDMNQEGEYTQWRDVDGVKFPGNFHHHTDWDDETQPPNYNGGHNSLTFNVKDLLRPGEPARRRDADGVPAAGAHPDGGRRLHAARAGRTAARDAPARRGQPLRQHHGAPARRPDDRAAPRPRRAVRRVPEIHREERDELKLSVVGCQLSVVSCRLSGGTRRRQLTTDN
jgi:hypothetical protein